MAENLLNDLFTTKFLQVIAELVKRKAMPRKGVFADGLKLTHSFLNKIERRDKNVPPEKQPWIIKYLYEHFGVNKLWWNKKEAREVVFDWEPAATRSSKAGNIAIPVKDYQHYMEMEKMIATMKEEIIGYRKQLGLPIDEDKSDINPDKSERDLH